ncbi:hypothetical protein GOODEAATRI_014919, partial [Goodea atripinnis]
KLRASWSNRLGEIARDIFFASVPAQMNLTAEQCENLWLNVENGLADQLQQVESTARQQLEDIRAELEKDQQELLYHKIMQYDCSLSDIEKLIEKKHEHLLLQVQRSFVVRHFSLHLLKEMRLSKLKMLSQTDFRALLVEDPSITQLCVDSTLKTAVTNIYPKHWNHLHLFPLGYRSLLSTLIVSKQNSRANLAERHLGPESQLLRNSLQQEFLSELETATELLQSHVQLALGNALSHAIHHRMEAVPTQSKASSKHDLSMKVGACLN